MCVWISVSGVVVEWKGISRREKSQSLVDLPRICQMRVLFIRSLFVSFLSRDNSYSFCVKKKKQRKEKQEDLFKNRSIISSETSLSVHKKWLFLLSFYFDFSSRDNRHHHHHFPIIKGIRQKKKIKQNYVNEIVGRNCRIVRTKKKKQKILFVSILTSVKHTTPFRKEITNYTALIHYVWS